MVPYKFATLQDVAAIIQADEVLCVDFETIGLYGQVRLAQFFQAGWTEVLLVQWPEIFQLQVLLAANFAAHNAHYEITTAQANGVQSWLPEKFEDTFLLARLALPKLDSYSYDAVVEACIGHDPYSAAGLDKAALQKSNWKAPVLTNDQLLYAAMDVWYMPDVLKVVQSQIDSPSYALDKASLKNCLVFQWHGMPISQERINAKYSENLAIIEKAEVPINVNSWQQVRKYLGSTESDDLALARMAQAGDERASKVRLVRKLRKQLSFLDKFQGERIYGKFKPSARSGRLTSDDQNLQQLPRALKGMFEAPEGRVLIYADYAQLELRTICAITNCVRMLNLFRNNEDLHTYTSSFLFGISEDKATAKWNRQVAKGCNFLLLYGGGIDMFLTVMLKTMDIAMLESQAVRARTKWRNLWPEIYAWQQRGISKYKRGAVHSTPLGREYLAVLLTDFLNIENQGAGAEVAKLAMHYFMRDCYSKYEGLLVCNFVHDSYILECDDNPEIYEPASYDLAKCMQLAWFEMSKCFKVTDLPMPIEIAVGKNWADIENDDIPNIYDYKLDGMAYYKEANS